MKVLSLFSGVGGFDMGLEAAGMVTAFQCEIDKYARSVLEHHWPDVPKWDDVTTLTGEYVLSATGGIDLVAWGSPCQDLSLAGKRAGLAGERSGLFHQGVRIIKEMRELSNGRYPTWSVWENVPGALSSNGGADFGQVLHEMDEAGACFSEWVVLDARYFGVPQRRRRVFVTSCFDPATGERCAPTLFPVAESLPGDSKKSGETWEDTTYETASCLRVSSGGHNERGDGQDNLVVSSPIGFSHTQGLSAQPSESAFPTLRSGGGGMAVAQDNQEPLLLVRRLSPLECERLQGWPDNHTAVGSNGPIADTHRYKMCGNGVASPVAAWLGKHIMEEQ